MRLREARADLRGYVDELLAKAVHRDALDRPMTADDKEALIEFLRDDGGLNARPRLQTRRRARHRSTARRKVAASSTTTCPPPGRTRAS